MTTKLESDSGDENEDTNSLNSENKSSDNEDNDRGDESNEDEHCPKNLAWADSVAKILKTKPKANQPIVLSKAKKLTEVKEKPQLAGFEVQLTDGNVKEEVIIQPQTERSEEPKHKRKRKREIPDPRVKPNILERDREKILTKIATKGVVQLFNAVKTQQKDIKEKLNEAGPLDVKKTKVLKNIDKNTFLDVLMSEKSQNVDAILEKSSKVVNSTQENIDTGNKKTKVWDVLRDNFMMDAKLKDWDKELEIDNEMEVE
ncbi:hypothetical protein HHI36_002787 [Cryptolaemus montrouzieri]|uniref:RRP15-like protein n=1 Tax=Cryptolaemus montrouzieri TaxID=559131 RepID=A0ABD2PBZ0_9CUCU